MSDAYQAELVGGDVLADTAEVLDPEFALEVALVAEVDRAVTGYRRKLAGRADFTNFEDLLPKSVRRTA